MKNLLVFLRSLQKKIYIATHNLSFDRPRLLDAIKRYCLDDEFQSTIVGFIGTLTVIRKKTVRKGKGQCTISGLADWLNISVTNAHKAISDIIVLEKNYQLNKHYLSTFMWIFK